MLIFVIGITTACGSSAEEDPNKEVTAETAEKVQQVQDENIELEEIDGELDSLINLLN